MRNPDVQFFRMKPNCVVGGVSWWTEGGVYRGRNGTGQVRTVHLSAPDGADSLEVLHGTVVEVPEPSRSTGQRRLAK
jgi:hypothetical protein